MKEANLSQYTIPKKWGMHLSFFGLRHVLTFTLSIEMWHVEITIFGFSVRFGRIQDWKAFVAEARKSGSKACNQGGIG